jgi:voltage-gated potassium channel
MLHDDVRNEILQQLRFGALSLTAVVLVGTSGYHYIGSGAWSYSDCLYMTMITLSTVGFGEVLHGMQDIAAARIWTLVLIVLGSGSLVFFVSSLTAFIVEGDIQGVIRRRRMQKQIDALTGHIDERLHRAAEERVPGMLYVHGDATDDHVLEQAGIGRARGLAATLPDDKDNVFVSITARALNGNLRIVSKMTEDSAESKLKRAGANATVSPSQIGGMRMASELVRPSVVQFLDKMLRDKQQALRVEEVAIPETSSLVGARLRETTIRDHSKVLVLAVHHQDGTYTYNPGPDYAIERGATLVVLCQRDEVQLLRQGIADGTVGRA